MTPRRTGDLPPNRRAIEGRTWRTTWRMDDFDPIERPPPRARFQVGLFADILLALLLGIGAALALVEWWSR